MQQRRRPASLVSEPSAYSHQQPQLPAGQSAFPGPRSHSPSLGSEDSLLGDEGQREFDLSEDEGLILDSPAFTGLFPPALFKSLLHKARTTTHLGVQATSLETPLSQG